MPNRKVCQAWHALVLAAVAAAASSLAVSAHDPGAPPITWNREISRLFYDRCVSCHRDGGPSFPLVTFQDVQPHAAAIKDSVSARRMPPWGAVKGFGDFRNDQGLTQQQIALITDWVEAGTPRGNNRNALPPPPKFKDPAPLDIPHGALAISGESTLSQPFALGGLFPERAPKAPSTKIVAELPDGSVQPLLWLYQYQQSSPHAFLLRKPTELPSGTRIRGVPVDARILLLPASNPGR